MCTYSLCCDENVKYFFLDGINFLSLHKKYVIRYMNIQDYRTTLLGIGINAEQDSHILYRLNAHYRNLYFVFEHDTTDDPYYFRTVLPVVADTSDGTSVDHESVNLFNTNFKATKIIQQGSQYHIVSEQFVFDYNTLGAVIQRVVEIMILEIVKFHETINNSRNDG